jgi:hypothetical protein
MHLVVVSSYRAAFARWRPRLVALNECRRSGVLPGGEKVRFVNVAHVGLLGGAVADSYELDEGMVSAAVVEIMEGRSVPAIAKGDEHGTNT